MTRNRQQRKGRQYVDDHSHRRCSAEPCTPRERMRSSVSMTRATPRESPRSEPTAMIVQDGHAGLPIGPSGASLLSPGRLEHGRLSWSLSQRADPS